MASCLLTSHVEVSSTDRVVGGRTIKAGQAIIVSDQLVGGGSSEIDICKIAQYVDGLLECVPLGDDLVGLSGTDGQVVAGQKVFISASAGFVVNDVIPGDLVTVSSGVFLGTWPIDQIVADTAATLVMDEPFPGDQTGLSWTLRRGTRPPDYSKVLRALPVSIGGLLPDWRYIPMYGPGDHFGTTMTTTAGSLVLGDVTATFNDPLRPIPTDGTGYIEILSGSDAGFHRITNVAGTTLLVAAPLNTTAGGISYRVRLVSPHATNVVVSDWGSSKVAIPIDDSFEIKIARPVRHLEDAQAFDASREDTQFPTRAAELLGLLGPYLACYRLEDIASQEQGIPVDKRVIIPALPWRGHAVDGVLFFDGQDPPETKYDLSGDDEPVWPIRWLRDAYRLEAAIARTTRQEPGPLEQCPDGI